MIFNIDRKPLWSDQIRRGDLKPVLPFDIQFRIKRMGDEDSQNAVKSVLSHSKRKYLQNIMLTNLYFC